MSPVGEASGEYLGAFLDGLEFALLALEGRLASTPETRAFIADYRRVLARHREAGTAPSDDVVRIVGRVLQAAELPAGARN